MRTLRGVGGMVAILGLLASQGCGLYFLDRDPNEAGLGAEVAGFSLPQAGGGEVSLASLRERGNVVLVFYRGHW